jgi:protein TonB
MRIFYLIVSILFLSASVNAQVKVVPAPPGDDEYKVFTKVEVAPQFPGGDAAWQKFLSKKSAGKLIMTIPENNVSLKKSTLLQFIVTKEGTISEIDVINTSDSLLKKEAIRVMKQSPKWIPATQNGRIVNAYRKVLIDFK